MCRLGQAIVLSYAISQSSCYSEGSPLDCKEIQPVHSEGDQSWVFFGRNDAKAEIQYFGHLMQRVDSLGGLT